MWAVEENKLFEDVVMHLLILACFSNINSAHCV